MELRQALGLAIRLIRKSRRLSQEQFDVVSSRTYLSVLERGQKSPTLDKLHHICGVMGIHPAALVCVAYGLLEAKNPERRIEQIAEEAKALLQQISKP